MGAFKAEPALLLGALQSLLSLAVTFGVRLTGEQVDLIMAFAGAALPIVLALVTRMAVYSPATVERMVGKR